MKRRLLRSEAGVTLLEIMTVAAIVGIVSAMAVPSFNTAIDRMNATATNRAMKSTIKLARSLAVSDKNPYGVEFNGTAMTVTVFKEVDNLGDFTLDPGDSIIRVDTLPNQFSLLATDMTNDILLFRPNGSATCDGEPNIYATAVTERIVSNTNMSVLSSTGRVDYTCYVY